MGVTRLSRIRAFLFIVLLVVIGGSDHLLRKCTAAEGDTYVKPIPFGTGGLYHPGGTQDLAYSPNGKILASLGTDGVTVLWDKNSKMLHRLGEAHGDKKAPPKDSLARIYFSGNSEVVAVVESSELKGVWDVASGKELRGPDKAKLGPVTALAIADNGSQLAVAVSDKAVRLFSLASGKELTELSGHVGIVNSLAFSEDGKQILSGSADKTARLWENATGKCVKEFKGHSAGVNIVVLSEDGKVAASIGNDKTARLWNTDSGKQLHEISTEKLSGTPRQLVFSGDGKSLIALMSPNTAIWWNVSTGEEARKFDTKSGAGNITALTWDGARCATADNAGHIQLLDTSNGKDVSPGVGHQRAVESIAISPDGKLLASASLDKFIIIWDRKSGRQLHRLEGHEAAVGFVGFSGDGKTLVSAATDLNGKDRDVWLWDVESGKQIERLSGQGGPILNMAMSADGKLVACSYFFSPKGSCTDSAVIIWDIAQRKELRRIEVGTESSNSVAFSPDGKNLVWLGWRSEFHVVDVASGTELRVVQPDVDKQIQSFGLRFSPVDSTAALELADGTFRIWNVVNGSQLRSMAAKDTRYLEHYEGRFMGLQRLAFSPDSKFVAVGGQRDHSIALLEVVSGKERVRLKGHKGQVQPVAFAPDGQTLYSGSSDGTLLAWDLQQLDIKPTSEKLGKRELESLRKDLESEDAVDAYAAIRTLKAYPEQAAIMLQDCIKPVAPIDQKVLDGLLADLGGDDFAKRKAAMSELEKLGELAEPALKRLLASKPKAELALRVHEILKKADVQAPEASIIQSARAMEVLENLDTPQAREILDRLAAGAEGALMTRQAKTALEYIAKRKSCGDGDKR
jgi:WD40 repeat protein